MRIYLFTWVWQLPIKPTFKHSYYIKAQIHSLLQYYNIILNIR